MSIQSVAVYCAENEVLSGEEEFLMAAARVGTLLAENGITVVYGGLKEGLMGVVADAALKAGGRVIGVVPKEVPEKRRHPSLTEMHIVEDLDARKKMMTELSDACIALPGGHGTFDELLREITLAKLDRKNGKENIRPVIIYDPPYKRRPWHMPHHLSQHAAHYFDGFIQQVTLMGERKKNNKDLQAFQHVTNMSHLEMVLGLRPWQALSRASGYESGLIYGFDPIYSVDPISDVQRTKNMRNSWKTLLAGISVIAAVNLAAPLLGYQIVLLTSVAGGFISMAGILFAIETKKRPAFNPPKHPGEAMLEPSVFSKLGCHLKIRHQFGKAATPAAVERALAKAAVQESGLNKK